MRADTRSATPNTALGPTPAEQAIDDLAAAFVHAGRVAPGLTVEDDGRARSWWWPLPAAEDRAAIAGVLVACDAANDAAGHRAVAERLAAAVDREVRDRLANVADPLPRMPGRRSLAELWLRSLASADPWLPTSVDAAKARALAAELDRWIAAALVGLGTASVSLRVVEPAPSSDDWVVEPLVHDVDEPSMVVPAAALWEDTTPFGPDAIEATLAALGRAVRIAPELAPTLQQATPGPTILRSGAVATLLTERVGPLGDAGVAVQVPAWWTNRSRLGVRARASTKDVKAVTAAGFGFDDIVTFTWEAALDGTKLTAADLTALRRAADAKRALVRVRGNWVAVRPAEITALLRANGQAGKATVGAFIRSGLGLVALAAPRGAEVVGVSAAGPLGRLLDDAQHDHAAPVATPPGFVGTLRPYQERGVGWLRFLGRLGLGACLADDMGLGKTAQVLASALADPVGGPTLVVCPTSVIGNWAREAARFTPTLRVLVHHGSDRLRTAPEHFAAQCDCHDLVVTSYGLLARDLPGLALVRWGRVVFDEAQQIKNPHTAAARAARQLDARRRIALTGTPVENRLSDLWAILDAVNSGLLGSSQSFRERFSIPIERHGDDEAAERLRRLVGPFVLRRLKTDRSIIDDLPDKVEMTERCPLTREQATLYQATVDDMVQRAEDAEGIERQGLVLAGIMKLKQICNHPAQFLRDGSPLAGRSGKLVRVEELLEELLAAGDKALCFTQFAEWGELLQPHLARRFGVEVLWLHGKTSRPQRERMVARFAADDGPPLFLLSLKAGGTGLNLTAASHVVHLDRWWNPAVEDQATDRAFRIGQHRNVLVHKLVATGTIEERIDDVITGKRALAGRVVGTGEQWITKLSTDELRTLLTYDPDTGA